MRPTLAFLIGLLAAAACRAPNTLEGSDVAPLPGEGTGPSDTPGGQPTPTPEPATPTPSPPEPPPPSGPKVSVTTELLEINGAIREVVLAIPTSYVPTRAYPLVVAFHGDQGTGPGMRAAHPVDDVSGEDAFVAYPSGHNLTWDLYTPTAQNVDVPFIEALVLDLGTRYSIDTTRLFGVGFSKGAFFVNQLACRKPTFFRAIAAYAGGAPNEPQDPSAGYWPNGYVQCAGQSSGVAALVVHGTDDDVVPFASGEFDASYWSYVNGCSSERSPSAPAPCERHAACPADKPVVFCPVPDLGHAIWPGAGQAAWSFFSTL
jgi:polyhydroxybutyrate depolymerase